MQFKIKNRIFRVDWGGIVLLHNEGYSTLNINVLEFWISWNVRSFELVILNFQFKTWNPTITVI